MRAIRVFLALLLTSGPLQAQPVVDLLSRYAIPADETGASAPEGDAPAGSGKQLAALEANLALMTESLEGFSNPQDADKALLAAKPRLPAGTSPFFKDRSTALGALYRTLALVDYTWALRFPDPPCAPAARRSALLRSEDGLFFDPNSGKTSEWMTALLGPSLKDKDLETTLDQASASAPPSEAEYARLRARQNLITKALAAADAVGESRAGLYCRRAETRLKLASANHTAGPVLAARSSEVKGSRRGVVIIAGKTDAGLEARGAGVVVDTKSGIRVLTDRRLGTGAIVALFDANNAPVSLNIEREDEKSGLLLLRPDGDLGEALIWSDAAPKKDDLVFALAHSDRLGAWTKTQGLVTNVGPNQFQTDAVADASMTGGAVLDEEGRVAGLLVIRRAEGSTIDWPAAVPAAALRAWIDGGEAPAALSVDLADEGTTKILTASRPLLQSVAVGEDATTAGYGFDTQTQWGSVHARCMANCGDSSPSSSYSDNGSAELGQALGKVAAIGAEALIFKGIPALFRGIGSLFKSKPRPAPPKIVEMKPATKPAPAPIQEVIQEPPAIECRVTKVGEPASIGIETVELKVRFSCNDASVPLGNRRITFTLGWANETTEYNAIIATTDANGYASISFHIDNAVANAARSFNDLDRYDPDKKPQQGAESIAATEPPADTATPQAEGLINASDSKPTKNEPKQLEAPANGAPNSRSVIDYAVTGPGTAAIRSVARVSVEREAVGVVAGRAVAGTAARGAAGLTAGEVAEGAMLIGSSRIPVARRVVVVVLAVSFGIDWAYKNVKRNSGNRGEIATPPKPGQPEVPKQDAFDALNKEDAASREDEDECVKFAQSGDTLARFIDDSHLASGYLQLHEKAGGHTILEHVDGRKTTSNQVYVIERLAKKKGLLRASAYFDLNLAESTTKSMVKSNLAEIESWITSEESDEIPIAYKGSTNIGYGVSRDNDEPITRQNAKARLRRIANCRILIFTSFPD